MTVKRLTIALSGVAACLVAGLAFTKGKEGVLWPAADIKWEEAKPPPGMKMPEGAKPPMAAALWGNMLKGPHGVLIMFQPGEQHPLHTHSAEIKGVVLEGTWIVGGEGGEQKKLGPGSYVLIPANWKHTS